MPKSIDILRSVFGYDGFVGPQEAIIETLLAGANNSGGDFYIGKDWGSGVTRTVSKCVVYSPTDQGFNNGANPSLTLKLQGSDDNATWTDLASETFTDITGQLVKTLIPT
ncbi:MAG: hypothetical protein EOM37_16435, partial [Proteobacteria bacterium]|nr:hypothetical protein [Pseudomonadota bacterium]